MEKKIILGSDKSGYNLKEAIKANLVGLGYEIVEVGTTDPEVGVPFFIGGADGAKKLQEGVAEKAILICGTGMGMSQVANKHKGVRAACVESVYAAKMCKVINDSNALCMGGWLIGPEMGIEMAHAFLNSKHTEGLEEWRQEFLKKAKLKFGEIEDEIYGV